MIPITLAILGWAIAWLIAYLIGRWLSSCTGKGCSLLVGGIVIVFFMIMLVTVIERGAG